MASILLLVAVTLLAIAILLLAYILVSKHLWNVQAVWQLAMQGHRPSRWYIVLIIVAFALAVASAIAARLEKQSNLKQAVLSIFAAAT